VDVLVRARACGSSTTTAITDLVVSVGFVYFCFYFQWQRGDVLTLRPAALWPGVISARAAKTNKNGDPVVGGWVRGQKRTRVRFFFRYCFIVLLNSPYRETPKNVIKKIEEKLVLDFWSNLLENIFNTIFFLQNVFCGVFELPSLRKSRKRDKTKKNEVKLTSKFLSIFLGKVFDMDFL
jgi:hypothetical protein